MLKVYTDAARDDYVSGIGYVIEGDISCEGKRTLEETHTSMEAEYYALIEGLRIAAKRSQSNECVEAYVDVEPLTTKMRVPDGNSEEWRSRRKSFHWLANKFDEWKLEHVSRQQNERAHRLAREALFEGRDKL